MDGISVSQRGSTRVRTQPWQCEDPVHPDGPTDRLARLAQRGDPRAVAELCRSCREPIFAYMRHVLESIEDAEEATQQVLLSILEGLPRYRQNGRPFMSWAFAIAHNHAVDLRRCRDRTVAMEPARLADVQELARGDRAAAIPRDQHSALRELLSPLSPTQQQVLTLLYEYDLSADRAAAVLGRSAASVRQEHRRARAKLREIVMRDSRRVFGDLDRPRCRTPRGGEQAE